MPREDRLLALLVVVIWGLNFVIIKAGLYNMPPLMLAGLHFLLVTSPVILLVIRPKAPPSLLLGYGLTISFRQFAFLFSTIKFGISVGLTFLVLQAQVSFTVVLGAFTLDERLRGEQLVRIALAVLGVLVLIETSLNGQHVGILGLILTPVAALSQACGNIFGKKIVQHTSRPAVMSLMVWSTLIPIAPSFLVSLLLDGPTQMAHSLVEIDMTAILSLVYLVSTAATVDYGIWGPLLGRYETRRVTPLPLLIPVVGLANAVVLLDEVLIGLQLLGALLVMAGSYINMFGFRLRRVASVKG